MENQMSCGRFRALIYERSDRKVNKQEHALNGHEATCLACVHWMLEEVAAIEIDHESWENRLAAEDWARLVRVKRKLTTKAKQLTKKRDANQSGEIEPTEDDLADIDVEVDAPDPVIPDDGDAAARSA